MTSGHRPVPEISILMTARNSAPFVAEAIESVLKQETARTWELLFVDDGSTDATLSIVTIIADRHPQCIRVLTHDGGHNRGISASRNLALRHAKGQSIAFLDSDDVWLPHHLETMTSLLDSMPEVAMVYAAAERWVDASRPFDEEAARAGQWGSNYLPPLVPEGEPYGLLPPGQLLEWFLQDESLVPCICTVLVRTEIARRVDGFCDSFEGLYDDQVFHAKVAALHWVFVHDECVARYRQHIDSCCARARADEENERHLRHSFDLFLATALGIRP
ncbi:Glycosyl transferase family 2 [Terriglobus roseus]|uniref:Glycosyl transferase family 2 n=1 Tax=Terriglobus roseus TaxID=392734 RepID=A0A1H4JZH0_9BACT|nr:Glycosyl transferase family 2 [Terriglobus roseus]